MKPPIDKGTVLLTGASAGIGRELARQLAPRASRLVLLARRMERLESLQRELTSTFPGLQVDVVTCDLSDSAAVDALLDRVTQELGAVDVLVNNAGAGDLALYDQADWRRIETVIWLNVVAIAKLTHRLVEPMVRHGRGGILNISSGAGVAIMPGAATYTGTKHFVTGFTETLRAELAGTGVVVTQVLPGPVETEFDEAAGMDGLAGGPPQILRISATRCAAEAIAGFDRGQAMVFPGIAYRALMTLQGLLPRALQRRMARSTARRLRNAQKRPAPALQRSPSAKAPASPAGRVRWRIGR